MKNPNDVLTIKLTWKEVAQLVSILDYFGFAEVNQGAIALSHKIRDNIQFYQQNDNRCVCCGEIIPEGRQVCPNCMRSPEDAPLVLKPVDSLRKEKK